MENGEIRTLHRLATVPLSPLAASSLMQHAAIAVAHVHSGPGICHRDLNADFIVQDVGGSLVLKLTEFELAALQKPLDSRIINNGLRK